jgi:hypothetical protein
MEQLQARGKDSSRERLRQRVQVAAFDGLRHKKLLETTADDFFAVFKDGKVSIVCFLKRLAQLRLESWLDCPADCRAVSLAEIRTQRPARHHAGRTPERFGRRRKTPSGNCIWNCFGKPARRRATRRTSRPRTLTGRRGRFPISGKRPARWRSSPSARRWKPCCSSCRRPAHCSRSCPRSRPTTAPAGFRRRCHKAGVSGVTLHCYRYAWAERAKVVGMPERFAQAALGHNSKAIHRAYAKKAVIIAPSLRTTKRKAASLLVANGCGLR